MYQTCSLTVSTLMAVTGKTCASLRCEHVGGARECTTSSNSAIIAEPISLVWMISTMRSSALSTIGGITTPLDRSAAIDDFGTKNFHTSVVASTCAWVITSVTLWAAGPFFLGSTLPVLLRYSGTNLCSFLAACRFAWTVRCTPSVSMILAARFFHSCS